MRLIYRYMPRTVLAVLLMAQAATPSAASELATNKSGERPSQQPAVVELLKPTWSFRTVRPAESMLTKRLPQADFAPPADATTGFTLKVIVDFQNFPPEKALLEIPDVLCVRLKQHDPMDRGRQNYPAFKMPDGSVPVLEARLQLHSAEHPDWKDMTIGIPLAMLKRPHGEHEIVLNFTGVRWSMYVDGELLDNDFPFGYPRWRSPASWTIDSEQVTQAELYCPAITPERQLARTSSVAPVQYWTPAGHNAWVGDVVTFFHRGRYHVFYLYDRRHHQSKFGQGAHYFEHLSTADFRRWTEHEAAVPIDRQWECLGTGTPFVFKDRFYLAYGLHTGRIYSPERTTWPAQWGYLNKNGRTGEFREESTSGVPAGSTYSVSTDGLSCFKKSGIAFHPCQNPSVYIDPQGRLRMLANFGSKGTWESESVDAGWRCIDPKFPNGGDCTFFFRWGKFDYIVGGFTGMWSKPANAPDSAYEDVVRQGLDFYDGLSVPAVTEIPGGRFVMAGWIGIRGWGGALAYRELIQSADGRIGSKWLTEIMPTTEEPTRLGLGLRDSTTLLTGSQSFLLTFHLRAKDSQKGRLAVSFLPELGERNSCEFQIDLDAGRAQFGPVAANDFGRKQKTLREGGQPSSGRDFAIENLVGMDQSFTVRVLVKSDDKIGGSLIDAEIAGQRTMITYRPDLHVKRLVFHADRLEVLDARIAPF